MALVTFVELCRVELGFVIGLFFFFFALNMTALHCTTEMYLLVLGESV